MKVVVFDTETTGLIKFNEPDGTPDQPDIVQLACILGEIQNREWLEISCTNLLLKDQKKSEERALETHKKTPEMLSKFGVPRRLAISVFHHLISDADMIVAHNIKFDIRMIINAYIRESVRFPELPRRFCTMEALTDVCKIPQKNGRPGYKWPSLMEAYTMLINPNGFEGAHDALADVRACAELMQYCLEKEIMNV